MSSIAYNKLPLKKSVKPKDKKKNQKSTPKVEMIMAPSARAKRRARQIKKLNPEAKPDCLSRYAASIVDPFTIHDAIIPDSQIFSGVGIGDQFVATTNSVADAAGGTSTASAAGVILWTDPNSAYQELSTYNKSTGALTWGASAAHPLYTSTLLVNFNSYRSVSAGAVLEWFDSLQNANGTYYALEITSGPASSTTGGVAPSNVTDVTQNPNTRVLAAADVEEGGIRQVLFPSAATNALVYQNINETTQRIGIVLLWIGSLKSGTAASTPVGYVHQYTMAHNWECNPDAAVEVLFPRKYNAEGSDDALTALLRNTIRTVGAMGSTVKSAADYFVKHGPAFAKSLAAAGRVGAAMLGTFGLLMTKRRFAALLLDPKNEEFLRSQAKELSIGNHRDMAHRLLFECGVRNSPLEKRFVLDEDDGKEEDVHISDFEDTISVKGTRSRVNKK